MSYLWNASLLLIGYGVGSNQSWALLIGLILAIVENFAYRHSLNKKENTMK
jgi:hypothetical protein